MFIFMSKKIITILRKKVLLSGRLKCVILTITQALAREQLETSCRVAFWEIQRAKVM